MKFNNEYLRSINIERFAKYAIFDSCDIDPTVLSKATKGIQITGRMVTEMLAHEVSDYATRFSDLADMLGVSEQEAKRMIRAAVKVGYDQYDGTYGHPIKLEPEQLIYIVAALTIQEYGRKTDNLDEYVVRRFLSDYVDIGAIESDHDMSCYAFLIDYFEYCLGNEKVPITRYLKSFAGTKVTSKRLMSFFKRNFWYNDANAAEKVIGYACCSPKLADITNSIYGALCSIRKLVQEEHEEYLLNKAFDSQ